MQKYTTKQLQKILISLLTLVLGSSLVAANIHRKNTTSNNEEPTPTPVSTNIPVNPTPIPSPSEEPIPVNRYAFHVEYDLPDFSVLDIDMSGFQSSFSLMTGDGEAYAELAYNQAHIDVVHGGSNRNSITLYRDGIPLTSNGSYLIYVAGIASDNRDIDVAVVNGNDGQTLYSQTLSLSPEEAFHELSFTYTGPTLYNGSLQFMVGQGEGYSVTIKDVRVVALEPVIAVRTNQVGYLPTSSKRCTFPYNAGDIFDVMDANTNQVVFSGPILGSYNDEATLETNSYGDFSTLKTPGTYYIRSQIGVTSAPFEIKETVYADLINDSIKMFSLQRCGTSLDESWAGALSHPECHTSQAKIYGVEEWRDVHGGWHDAGDYGRYVETGTKAVDDLLMAYLYAPSLYGDNTNGPDSNNGIPDILDEARYELEWLLRMQNGDGGVYNTVITDNVSNNVMPNEDTQNLNLLYIESTSTSDFFVASALASIVYKEYDEAFANTCLEAAKQSKKYLGSLSAHVEYPNPTDINGGLYLDDDDLDSQLSGNLAMFVATGEKQYLEDAKYFYYLLPERTCANGVAWRTNGGYGRYLFLTYEGAQKADPTFYADMVQSLQNEANQLMHMAEGNGYHAAIYEYPWASNSDIANHGIILSMAYDILGDPNYLRVAVEQLNYLLGKNSLDMSYVTGYGHTYPHHVHSRMSLVSQAEIKGALVGGPDEHRDDKVTAEIGWDVPAAKVYRDEFESYSTNEIAIIYNSALVHLLSRVASLQ